jgi:hypothetical protein
MLKRISEIGYRNVGLVGLELPQIRAGFFKIKNKLLISTRDEEFADYKGDPHVLQGLHCMELLDFRIFSYTVRH